MALDGGADGLKVVRKIIRQAAARLTPQGVLLLEIGGLRDAIEAEFGGFEPAWLATGDGSDSICLFHAGRLPGRAHGGRK